MPNLSAADPQNLPLVLTTRAAREYGFTKDQVRQRVRARRWIRLARGVFLTRAEKSDDAVSSHIVRSLAQAARHANSVVAIGSAAAFHGLPLPAGIPERVQLLVPATSWNGLTPEAQCRVADLDSADLVDQGVPVTCVARTWLDLTRTEGLETSLIVGDFAMNHQLMSVAQVNEVIGRWSGVRGAGVVRNSAGQLSELRESALESRSWARFLEWGIPLPQMQVDVHDNSGFVGRVDFRWPHARVVGEADGRVKYQTRDDLYAEKRREDRLRALGLTVVRWSWHDLDNGGDLVRRRLELAFARAS
jgi:hypothetical protein